MAEDTSLNMHSTLICLLRQTAQESGVSYRYKGLVIIKQINGHCLRAGSLALIKNFIILNLAYTELFLWLITIRLLQLGDNAWNATTDILIGEKSNPKYTSYYWVVDYERDADGNPILDGAYTIQLFATDKLYWHTKSHAISNSASLNFTLLTGTT